ncbi:MAG: hypothetical protein ABIR03_01735 [Ginsengibacter sp.]
MKTKYLFLVGLVVAFSSCSTAYRTGQTPDDVYYSPAPAQNTYVRTASQDERDSYGYRNDEEQDIRRGIRDQRYRSNVTLDIGYGYNPYAYNPYAYNNPYSYNPYSYNSPYSFDPYGYKGIYDPYSYNPYYNNYSPYYGRSNYSGYYGGYYSPVYVLPVIGRVNTNTGPRKYNLGAYNSPTSTSRETIRTPNGSRISGVNTTPARTFKPTNQGTGVGNVIRRVFTPSESRTYTQPSTSNNKTYRSSGNDNRVNTAPERSFNNPPSSNNTSTPSSSESSGSAPVRIFRK